MEIFHRAIELKNTQEEIAHSIKRVIVRVGGGTIVVLMHKTPVVGGLR